MSKDLKKESLSLAVVEVTKELDRFRADRALASLIPEIGRKAAKLFFVRDQIRINGNVAKGSDRVSVGDRISYPDPKASDAREIYHHTIAPRLVTPHGRHITRIYEDESILVISKPSEIPVHRGQGGFTRRDTLEDVLMRAYPGSSAAAPPKIGKKKPRAARPDNDEEFGIIRSRGKGLEDLEEDELSESQGKPTPGFFLVHRLDQETSGCLLVAKSTEILTKMVTQFAERKVRKQYYALVVGEVPWKKKEVKRPIKYEKVEDPSKVRRVQSKSAPEWVARKKSPKIKGIKHGIALEEGDPKGKAAETHFEVKERFKGYTLLRCFPKTGRTHQIRVHLAGEGFPLAFDPLYGRRSAIRYSEIKQPVASNSVWGTPVEDEADEQVILNRLPLHARKLAFEHPLTGEFCEFEAPVPRDLRDFLSKLRIHRSIKPIDSRSRERDSRGSRNVKSSSPSKPASGSKWSPRK